MGHQKEKQSIGLLFVLPSEIRKPVKKTLRGSVFRALRCRNFSHLREHKVRDEHLSLAKRSDGSLPRSGNI